QSAPGSLERPTTPEKENAETHQAGGPADLIHHAREVECEDGTGERGDAEVDALGTRFVNSPQRKSDRPDGAPRIDSEVLGTRAGEHAEHQRPKDGRGGPDSVAAAQKHCSADGPRDGNQPCRKIFRFKRRIEPTGDRDSEGGWQERDAADPAERLPQRAILRGAARAEIGEAE